MKFSSDDGKVITMYGDQKTSRECYIASLKPQPERVICKNKKENLVAVLDLEPRVYEGDRI